MFSNPAAGENLTAKYYANEAIAISVPASFLVGLDTEEKLKLDEQGFLNLNFNLT